MQLLMRRPEVEGFISIAAPANLYDFSFLAPCPSSGLFVHGDKDAVVPVTSVGTLVEKLKTQKGIVIDQHIVKGANHFFDGKVDDLMEVVNEYLDRRLPKNGRKRGLRFREHATPPVTARHTPVVVGNDSGRPFIERTAR